MTRIEYIPLDECMNRGLYELHSRNLTKGVFCSRTKSFIGIREKFGRRFLDREFHWDVGSPGGTACPLKYLGWLPPNILLMQREHTYDRVTKRLVLFDRPISEGGTGWYFAQTGEPSQDIRPVADSNRMLHDWLLLQETERRTDDTRRGLHRGMVYGL